MNTIKRRIERLEQSDNETLGFAERMEAAFNEDPEVSNEKARRGIAETEAAVREGRYVSPLELRITAALRDILCDEGSTA